MNINKKLDSLYESDKTSLQKLCEDVIRMKNKKVLSELPELKELYNNITKIIGYGFDLYGSVRDGEMIICDISRDINLSELKISKSQDSKIRKIAEKLGFYCDDDIIEDLDYVNPYDSDLKLLYVFTKFDE